MRRRDLLKTAAAAVLTSSVAPRLGRGADRAKTLVFVGVADLSVLDPVVTGFRPTRNAAYLVFDTLYGIDTEWKAQPQMVEGHIVEEDGLTWTLKLRDGLRGGNVPAIMPERLAAESPFKPVAEVVGSGPYRFRKDEHVSGARAIFERFAEYQPRPDGTVGFTAGPKVAHFERVEWLTLDPFSAAAALRRGEIDWWENPSRDLVDQVSGDPNIIVVSHFATANGMMYFNQRYPPFDNPAIRRALLGAVNQAEAMSAIAGIDRSNWRDDVGLFGSGSPFATGVGVEIMRRPRDYAAVKRALAEAGYKSEKIVVMAPTDAREIGDLTRTGAEQLRRADMNIDLQEMDFANVVRRQLNQGPPDKGSYNMRCGLTDRSLPNVHPFGNLAIRADGKEPANGWANSPRIEELRAAWLDTPDLEQQKRICVELQKQLWEDVPFIPMGEYWQATAYRKDLTDILPGCFATFYGVRRA
jgi:peptide/nickel transport system substrate-binding protein